MASPLASDGTGDLGGVALLAVLAQQASQPPLVPGVDDLGGGEWLLWIHAHVQWGVIRVREAALPRVHLHGGHAQIQVDEVGGQPLLAQLVQSR